jgi:SagB-type dehydrogenase family enzyme
LETYLFTASGVYKYIHKDHSLTKVLEDDLRKQLSDASLGQTAVSDAHAVFVFTMIEERTAQRYGERAFRYICMEAGHVAQNIHLQAVALGLGSVPVGAFDDNQVSEILKCNEGEVPIYIVPVGYETMEE